MIGRLAQTLWLLAALLFYGASGFGAWRYVAYPTYRQYARERWQKAEATAARYRAIAAKRERGIIRAEDLGAAIMAEVDEVHQVPCEYRRVRRSACHRSFKVANLATGEFYGANVSIIDLTAEKLFSTKVEVRTRRFEKKLRQRAELAQPEPAVRTAE